MEEEKLKRRKAMVSNSILPWFSALSDDLMFFIVINSLFLTIEKGLSAAQISFLTTASTMSYILLQIPALKVIQKIGNVNAIRMGCIMLLCGSVIITFANHYFIIMIGYIFYSSAYLLKKMDSVILEDNLQYLNKQKDFVKISSKSKVIYAVITTIIALITGSIFAFHHYLPMYLCIGVCVINILLSFCIFDAKEDKTQINSTSKKEKVKFSKMVLTIFVSYAILYAMLNIGQSNSKLFIQYNLTEYFDVDLTANYLGIIIITSRISRILGNFLFRKVYTKYTDKVNIFLSIMAMLAFACVFIGSCFQTNLLVKFAIMTIGFDIILAIRDSVEVYTNNLLLKNTCEQEKQKAISYLQLARKIGEGSMSLLFSIMLTKIEMKYVIVCLFSFAVISIGINRKLYKMVKQKEGVKA